MLFDVLALTFEGKERRLMRTHMPRAAKHCEPP